MLPIEAHAEVVMQTPDCPSALTKQEGPALPPAPPGVGDGEGEDELPVGPRGGDAATWTA